ncbi:unannotated protein [freshwater metagenome]|uniref:Unannotated protein n=1 Tax=freshwater metagenome TaxID=449393 RepID=A0A6J7SX38_9ZZZZ
MPGKKPAKSRPNRESCCRSANKAPAAPGYCTFTATSRPSCQTARCTWPIEAAAAGSSSKDVKRSRQFSPNDSRSTWYTDSIAIGGAESWSFVSDSRYGPATSSGRTDSKTLSACPNFMAPPLSSPRTLKICSAVFAWACAVASCADMPPKRLPNPIARRPTWRIGRAAIRALRPRPFWDKSVTPNCQSVKSHRHPQEG